VKLRSIPDTSLWLRASSHLLGHPAPVDNLKSRAVGLGEVLVVNKTIVLAVTLSILATTASAQNPGEQSPSASAPRAGTVPAVSYGARRGSTRLLFRGTAAMQSAIGEAKVEAQRGFTRIEASFTDLQNPTVLGHEYLTYIMWAVSPDGRAVNLGEVLLPGDRTAFTSFLPGSRSTLNVTTPLQTFALLVTAEPYYAVRDPSTLVILENVLPVDASATPIPSVETRYDFTGSGGYVPTGFRFDPILLRSKLPLDFFQARNAVRIAQAAGAEQHAAAILANAMTQLERAEKLAGQKSLDKRALTAASREAVQTAEDARAIAAPRAAALRADAERKAAAARDADARAQAQAELERRLQTEAQRAAAAEADRKAAEAERHAAELRREESDRASAQAHAAAQEAMRARAEAEALRAAAQRAQAEAEKHRAAALLQQQAAEAEAARNRAAAAELDHKLQQAVREREDLRASLLQQLNVILETSDTARGLVVNLSDVTFATGQATLEPGAREKLARVSGILAAHPTLRLEIEGHTDSVGSDAFNQTLSERRAEAVRNYLIHQGVPEASTTAEGFGKSRPVASNDSPEGRQLNRRVELVVSGEAIEVRR
jgi:outer membrane protein OmpA-like peptidoglycan-associated protein